MPRPRAIYQGDDLWPGFTPWCFWKHANRALYKLAGIVACVYLLVHHEMREVLLGAGFAIFLMPVALTAIVVVPGIRMEQFAAWAGRRAGGRIYLMVVVANFAVELAVIAAWVCGTHWLFTRGQTGTGYVVGVLWAFFVVQCSLWRIVAAWEVDDLPNHSAVILCWLVSALLLGTHALLGFSVIDTLPVIAAVVTIIVIIVCSLLLGRPQVPWQSVSLSFGNPPSKTVGPVLPAVTGGDSHAQTPC